MLIPWWWKYKIVQPLWKIVWQLLIKLNLFLTYDPAIIFLGIHLNELKGYVHTKTCTQMFTESLFITTKTWKHTI